MSHHQASGNCEDEDLRYRIHRILDQHSNKLNYDNSIECQAWDYKMSGFRVLLYFAITRLIISSQVSEDDSI